MKKLLSLPFLMLIFCCFSSAGQVLPAYNGSFEVWDTFGTSGNIILPDNWPTSDLLLNSVGGYNTRTIRPDKRSHTGTYAVMITTDTAGGKIWSGFLGCKTALQKRAHSMSFYFVDSLSYLNSSQITVGLYKTKNGKTDSLGGGIMIFPPQYIKNYTYAELPIDYVDNDSTNLPDTALISFLVAQKSAGSKPGYVLIDDVGFVIHNSGIDLSAGSFPFDIYPNPSAGTFFITSLPVDDKFYLTISDGQGKNMIDFGQVKNNTHIDLSAYPSGVYFARIVSGNRTAVKKLVLVK